MTTDLFSVYGSRYQNLYMSSFRIEDKLRKAHCSLEDLLDEEDIVLEMRNQNMKIVNFFDKEKTRKLVELITVESEDDNNLRGYKYPFIASQLLNSDVNNVNDYFLMTDSELSEKERKGSTVSITDSDQLDAKEEKNEVITLTAEEKTRQKEEQKRKNKIDLLDFLFKFVETDIDLNDVLCGYFASFLTLLVTKYPVKIISYIFTQRSDIIQKLIFHSNQKSIGELVSKIIFVEDFIISAEKQNEKNEVGSSTEVQAIRSEGFDLEMVHQIRNRMLELLFKKIDLCEKDQSSISSIVSLCMELIEKKPILEEICMNRIILEHIFAMLTIDTNVTGGEISTREVISYNYAEVLNLLIAIVKFNQIWNLPRPRYKANSIEDNDMEYFGSVTKFPQAVSNTLLGEITLSHIGSILKNFFLGNDQNSKNIQATDGHAYLPLGLIRIRLVELILYLINYCKDVQSVFDNVLIRSGFFKQAFSYLIKYEWNNLYQRNFINLMKSYLNEIGNHPEITSHLFGELKLIQVLMSQFDSNSVFTFKSKRKINHGYFAVLIELCYKINSIGNGQIIAAGAADKPGSFCFTKLGENHVATVEEEKKVINENSILKPYLTKDWKSFFQEKVLTWVRLFEKKLCVNEQENPLIFEENEEECQREIQNEKEIPGVDQNKSEDSEHSNVQAKDEYSISLEESDFLKKKEEGEDIANMLQSFDFAEDPKLHSPKKNRPRGNSIKVDELEEDNYNDANFWKGVTNNVLANDVLSKALEDLEF